MNKYLESLVKFVEDNENFVELLKHAPYNLKTLKECSWHKGWYMFVYNLFDSDLKNDVVRACRGTVLEVSYVNAAGTPFADTYVPVVKVISAPYTKFFGYGDPSGKDIEDSINWANAKFQLKIDGIIIKTAKVDEKLYFFTNGSFDLNAPLDGSFVVDEAATRGAEYFGDLLKYAIEKESKDVVVNFDKESGEFYAVGGWCDNIPSGSTLMLELVSPRNKILCEYKETKLYWHGFRNALLEECDPRSIKDALKVPFECPELLDASNFDDLKKLLATFNGSEKEGCVVVDYSSEGTPRAKIKCDSYLKLKFARDNDCNSAVLFKAVVNDEYDDLLAAVPSIAPSIDEIKGKIKEFYSLWNSRKLEVSDKLALPKKDYVMWVRANINREQVSVYMDFYSPVNKAEKRLMHFAVGKKGAKEFDALVELLR